MTGVRLAPAEALLTLFSREGKDDPYPIYEGLREQGPLIALSPQWLLLTGYEECARALRETRFLSTDAAVQDKVLPGWREHASWRWLTTNMLFSNDPDHERYRRFFTTALNPRSIERLTPAVEQIVDDLVDRFAGLVADGGPVDFMDEFAFRLPMAVMSALMGLPTDDPMRFRADIGDITLALEPIFDPAQLDPGDAAMERLAAFFTDLVARRRVEPTEDLVGSLVTAADATGELSERELVANFMLLLVAGTEAPMDLIGNAMGLAVRHPDQAAMVAADPALAAGLVEETMRFDPPVHALNRLAVTDLDFFGTPVAADSKITLLIGCANRDPRRFPDPDRFDITRPNNQSLTFSAGGHYCLGAVLARLQTEIAFPRLLARLPGLVLAGQPSIRDQLVQRGYDKLPLATG
jgi:cytochrome P450